MAEPEVTISSELVFQQERVSVRVDRVRLADGAEGTRYVIDVPEVVVIVAVDADGDLLLVRQYRRQIERDLLELPAGVIEPGEAPVDAAQRELREETGYAAAQLTEIGGFYAAPGTMSEYLHAFLATGLTNDPLPADDDERIVLERIPLAEAMVRARAGELHDGKTLATLLLAERHLPTR